MPLVQGQTAQQGDTDAQIIYTPASAPWTIKLWGKNLTDETHVVYAANYYFFALTQAEYLTQGLREADRVVYNQPRTFGVTVDYKF